MTDFEYDCLQKKRLARQAQHKKNGSKSRRCSMSTDHMTAKEWKERNGKVVSVNINKPTTWANFVALSKNAQEEYLCALSATYGANTTNLAEMFDVSTSTIRRHIRTNGLGVRFHVGHKMNAAQRAAWDTFLCGKTAHPVPCVPQPEEEYPKVRMDTSMRMDNFSLSFSGDINVDMIANSLKHILGENASGRVEIECSLVGGC